MSRPGFYFCICPDSTLISWFIQKQIYFQDETWKIKTFWADEELSDNFWESLIWTNLLGEAKAIVLRKTENLSAESWKKLQEPLSRFRPGIWPFICLEKEWVRGKPQLPTSLTKQKYWQVAKKKGWIWQSSGMTRSSLQKHISEWSESKGIEIPSQIFEVLLSILPLDASKVINELEKLELYVQDKKLISSEDLEVISVYNDMDIFAFLKSLQTKNQGLQVWRKIFQNQLGANTDMILPFLALILREARILWQLSAGESDKVWLPPQVKTEKTALARSIERKKLASIWSLVLEAETGIKSGERSPEQALESLVSGLMQIFTP